MKRGTTKGVESESGWPWPAAGRPHPTPTDPLPPRRPIERAPAGRSVHLHPPPLPTSCLYSRGDECPRSPQPHHAPPPTRARTHTHTHARTYSYARTRARPRAHTPLSHRAFTSQIHAAHSHSHIHSPRSPVFFNTSHVRGNPMVPASSGCPAEGLAPTGPVLYPPSKAI